MLSEPNPHNDYFKRHEEVNVTTYREAGVTYHRTPWGDLDDFEYLEYLRERFGPPPQDKEPKDADR